MHYRAQRAGWPKPSVPATVVVGDTIEDESGWWQVEEIRDGEAVLIDRDGGELVVDVPSLTKHSRR